MRRFAMLVLVCLGLGACAPEIGTEKWCAQMDETPVGDWTANNAKAYAQYCALGNYVDKE